MSLLSIIYSIALARSFRIYHIDELHFIGNVEMWIVNHSIEGFGLFFMKCSLLFNRFAGNFDNVTDSVVKWDAFDIYESGMREMIGEKQRNEFFLPVTVKTSPHFFISKSFRSSGVQIILR